MDLSAHDIILLPLSDKERHHPSRSRLPFHVFLSHYCIIFKGCNEEMQIEKMHLKGVLSDGVRPVKYKFIYKLAKSEWASLTIEQRNAWEQRTLQLNSRPTIIMI